MAIENKLGLDASQFVQAVQAVEQSLAKHNMTIEQTAVKYVQLNKAGEIYRAGLRAITTEGEKLDFLLKKKQGTWDAHIKKINLASDATKRATEEAKKLASAQSGPAKGAPKVDPALLGGFAQRLQSAFPVPANASASSLLSYQTALNNLIRLASTGKVPLQDLNRIINDLARAKNPFVAVAGANANINQATAAIQRLIAAQRNASKSATDMEERMRRAGLGGALSFTQMMRVLEIQVIHRAFGALITGMQQSVGAAAQLQISISEVRTIAQQSGISFSEFQGVIRSLSEEFGRSQMDVVTAMYEGFSNQVIKSREDLIIMNEVLRFSRIAVSSATDSMNLLSSAINAYNVPVTEARQLSDQLFRAIDIGRFRASDIANTFGRVAVTAREVGVEFTELLGTMSLLTRSGVTPAEAMTQISSIMQALIRPSQDMSELLREWGVDSGIAAVRTFGFVGVLQRLIDESQKGSGRIGELVHNVRALRGVLGVSGGGGLDELRNDINQIRNATDAANRAAEIMSESAGDKFQKEMIKISNFFTTEFGNQMLTALNAFSDKFGGFSQIVKDASLALLDILKVGLQFISWIKQAVDAVLPFDMNIGTLIKGFVLWKTTLLIHNTVMSASIALQALYTTSLLSTSAAQLTSAQSAAVNMTALMSQTAATASATVATTGLALAMNIAWSATIIGAIAAASAALGTFLINITTASARIDRIRQELSDSRRNLEQQAESNARREAEESTRSATLFREELAARTQLLLQGTAVINRSLDGLVNAQREAVSRSTDLLKEKIQSVKDAMAEVISDIRSRISDASNAIRESIRRTMSFADRDSTSFFERQFDAAGQGVSRTNVQQLSERQRQIAAGDFDINEQARTNQVRLSQGRINQLLREAQELSARGDRESMESARRKFEEARRLMERQHELETQIRRDRLRFDLEEQARRTGQSQSATFDPQLEQLQRRLGAIRLLEETTEERFRRMQEAVRQAEERRLEAMRTNQRALNDALDALQRFRIVNDQGSLLPDFAGPQGMENAMRQFDERVARIREQMNAAGIDPSVQVQLFRQIESQRNAIHAQGLRERQRAEMAAISQRIIAEREAIERARNEGQRDLTAALSNQRNAVPQAMESIEAMLGNVQRFGGRSAANSFSTLVQEFRRASVDFQQAQGTEREAEAMTRLAGRLNQVTSAYQEFLRSQDAALRTAGVNTQQAIADADTVYNTTVQRLRDAPQQIQAARNAIADAERRSQGLQTAIMGLPPALQEAMIAGEMFGQRLEAGLGRVATSIEALGNRLAELFRQIQNPPQPSGRPVPVPVPIPGRREGGMVGAGFNSGGPDNTLIAARTGEFVVNPDSTRRFYPQLVAMNAGRFPHFNEGGLVGGTTSTTNVGDIIINESKGPDQTARAVVQLIRREERRNAGRR